MNAEKQTGAMPQAVKCARCGAVLPASALEGLCPACLLQQGAAADTATQPESPPFEPLSVADVSQLFPQLEILELIGKGGMGAVYKARQPALDRLVALKILPPRAGSGSGFADRFNREARALARLSHPSIVAVHEFGQVNDLPYFVMEFVDGVNLRQLQKAGRVSPREALQIIPQICDALQYAHDEGVVHRDIKPENVLVDRKGRVKIADFGLAKLMGRNGPDELLSRPADTLSPSDGERAGVRGDPHLRLTGEGQVMGTPHYMAPEQVEHPLEVDHRADIYSLGVVFYEMLTGELPLGKFAPPSTRVRGVQLDVRLDEVVLRSLEKEPARRYQHAREVKTDVETIAGSAQSPPQPPVQPALVSPAQLERGRWLIIAAAFILCLAGSVMGFNSPPLLGIPLALWSTVGFILVTVRALRSGGTAEQDLAIVRAARQILMVDAIGFCLGALLMAAQSSGLNPPFRIFIASACATGIVVAGLRLDGIEPLSFLLGPRAGQPPTGDPQGLGAAKRSATAAKVGAAVACLTFLALALVTFLLPKSYLSTARVGVEVRPASAEGFLADPQMFKRHLLGNELAVVRSAPVLDRVVKRLGLEERWGSRYGRGARLRDYEALALLKERLDVRLTRNPALMEIGFLSEDRTEAAEIANAMAESYQSVQTTNIVEIVDRAQPALRAVRPNWPLNLAVGAGLGPVLGLLAAGLTLLLSRSGRPLTPPLAGPGSGPSAGRSRAVTVELATHPWGARIGLALVVLTGLVLVGFGLHAWRQGRSRPSAPAADAGPSVSFGPVIERLLPCSAPCAMKYFQFHTGDIFAIGDGPGDTSGHAEEWRRAEATGGLDVSVIGGEEGLQLAGRGCIFTRDSSPNWDTLTAEEAIRTLRRESWLSGVIELRKKDFPATYLFKTAMGEGGLLQILGVTADPRGWNRFGLKFRYKLVQAVPESP